ncbi:MAG: TRAP transporter substrate-binding protein DctP [Thermodesulfovibrionia bacterium]
MDRREFIKKGIIAGALAGASIAPNVHASKTYNWRMVTAWQPHFPVLGEGAEMLARLIEEMSDGRLKIRVYGGGELVPPLEAFDAVSQGVVEMGHAASYYWAGKSAATQFFTSIPFGMNAQQMNAWLYAGDGLKLWEEVYAPFNLIPMPAGNTGVQMGGWFNKEINSIKDIKGLKMRIPGLGGKVISRAGGTAVLSPGGEIYTNLERGVIDAAEWVGPYHDYLMGFHKIARYYYYPGWQEPGSVLEVFINKRSFEGLPKDLQAIIRTAAHRTNIWMLSEFESKNNIYLKKLVTEHKVKLRRFPDDVLKEFRRYSEEVIHDITSKDALSRKVYESFSRFKKDISEWANVSEVSYYSIATL